MQEYYVYNFFLSSQLIRKKAKKNVYQTQKNHKSRIVLGTDIKRKEKPCKSTNLMNNSQLLNNTLHFRDIAEVHSREPHQMPPSSYDYHSSEYLSHNKDLNSKPPKIPQFPNYQTLGECSAPLYEQFHSEQIVIAKTVALLT